MLFENGITILILGIISHGRSISEMRLKGQSIIVDDNGAVVWVVSYGNKVVSTDLSFLQSRAVVI